MTRVIPKVTAMWVAKLARRRTETPELFTAYTVNNSEISVLLHAVLMVKIYMEE